jgi:HPt (histidine-containing phosphotransfer) domain-containing protein
MKLPAHGKVLTAIVGSYPKPRYVYPRSGRSLLDSFGGNSRLLGEVIDVFVQDAPRLAAQMKDAAVQGDRQALASTAHALKGSPGLFSKGGPYERASRLVQAARAGELSGVLAECNEAETEVAELIKDLVEYRNTL